ncbi:hypothetical protein SAOR_14370 [Salinisphaera orenii MK-B5]|uniref:Branched-chain amino acid ABC transporter permease n=1 Tax=Salinisphaera orenii MK-B5 TaxID=856730 RepID=A0A423PGG6_9GAMM|nr:branched-chain amino acid ABC transporter permease [Salinisphaera orenii]ROO24698.1 hypothetical protein SAOR_14370 [Salinisphaera orenii MK-B5]
MSHANSTIKRRPRAAHFGGENAAAFALLALLVVAPFVAGDYIAYILPQYMLYGLLAVSLVMLWGVVGIVSFGQAAFFAIGAYAMGLCMGQSDLGFNSGYAGLASGALAGGLLAGVTGWFLFSAGVKATYFVLITLALSIITEQVAVSQSQLTGGFNGMFVNRMALSPFEGGAIAGDIALYFFVLGVVAVVYALLRWLMASSFGTVLAGVRENEDRLTALGYRIDQYKTLAFALSGAIAGLAGALYATTASFVSPSLAGVLFSTQVVVWVAIGGRSSLLGGLVGAMVVATASNYLSATMPQYWQLILGVAFMLVIIFFKDGFAGMFARLGQRLRPREVS